MADNKDKKVLNVPALRFPEFTEEWKKIRLGDNCNIQMCKRIMAAQTNTEGGVPFYKIGTIGGKADAYISKDLFDEYKRKYSYPNKGEVMITCAGTVGKCVIYDGEDSYYQDSNIVWIDNPNEIISNDFLYHLLSNINWSYLNSTTIVRIYNDDLRNLKLCCPRLDEQKKIANFLSLIDERIAAQNKIIEDLKKLKSAIIDKSFCYPNESSPQKRFIGFTEEWHLVHLSDICQRVRTKNFNTQCTLVLTIAAQFGLVSQEEFFNKSVASDNLEGYYLLRKGDFAYNKSYSGDYAWGAVKRLECFSEGVLSPLYICFRPDTARIDSDFLAHYFESKKWYKGIADIAGEGARNHGLLNLSVIDYFKTLHRIPSIQEQKAIANALNKLTSKISIEKNLYDDLLLQRQHLLQQMFI